MAMFDFFGMQDPERWRKLFNDAQRYGINVQDMSLFRPGATIQGTGSPSLHGSGRAVDLNPTANPVGPLSNALPSWDALYGDEPTVARAQAGSPVMTRDIAGELERQNPDFKWGGRFRNTGLVSQPDPMHWQYKDTVPQMPQSGHSQYATAGGAPGGVPSITPTVGGYAPITNPYRAGQVIPGIEGQSLARMIGGDTIGGFLENIPRNRLLMWGLDKWSGGSGASGLGVAEGYARDIERSLEHQRGERTAGLESAKYGLDVGRYGLEQRAAGRADTAEARAQAVEARAATDWQRLEEQRRAQIASFEQAVREHARGGAPALFKGLSPEAIEVIKGLGPLAGYEFLGKYQLSDLEKRAEFNRKLENLARLRAQRGAGTVGLAPNATAAAPSAPAGPLDPSTVAGGGSGLPALPGELAPQDYSTPTLQTAPPNVAPLGPTVPPAPRAAAQPAPARSVAAPPARQLPPITPIPPGNVFGRPLDEAKQEARDLDFLGMRDEVLEKEIARVEEENKTPPALKQAAIQADVSLRTVYGALDRYNNAIKAAGKSGQFIVGGGFMGGASTERDAAEEELNNIVLLMKELYGLGQISKGDMDLASNLPNINAGLMPTGRAAPRDLVNRTQASVDRFKERVLEIRNEKMALLGQPPITATKSETAAPKKAAAPKREGPPPKITGDADPNYKALKKGDEYLDPFGRLKRKSED